MLLYYLVLKIFPYCCPVKIYLNSFISLLNRSWPGSKSIDAGSNFNHHWQMQSTGSIQYKCSTCKTTESNLIQSRQAVAFSISIKLYKFLFKFPSLLKSKFTSWLFCIEFVTHRTFLLWLTLMGFGTWPTILVWSKVNVPYPCHTRGTYITLHAIASKSSKPCLQY